MGQPLKATRIALAEIPDSPESAGIELPELLGALPAHRGSLSICHNEHKDNGIPVAEWAEIGNLRFASADERQQAIDNDELWTMHWYPEAPDRFATISAATLSALLGAARDIATEAA